MESVRESNGSGAWSPKMPQGMDFEISRHPLTMKQVVNLIIAMERFKGNGSELLMSSEFRDEDMLNIMLDGLVEGNPAEATFVCFSFSVQLFWLSSGTLWLPVPFTLPPFTTSLTRCVSCPLRGDRDAVQFAATSPDQLDGRAAVQHHRPGEEELNSGPKQHAAPRGDAAGRLRGQKR